jgi:AcrR family transcriptional regulator
VGNRADILRAAKLCLVERGWAGTTVRDIGARAGANHAAISYHFGSRERLLIVALMEELDELGERMAARWRASAGGDRLRALLASADADKRLWTAYLEAVVAAQRFDELRTHLAQWHHRARAEFGGPVPVATMLGLMIQSLVDPDCAAHAARIGNGGHQVANGRVRRLTR